MSETRIYEINSIYRYVCISSDGERFPSKAACINIDDVGMFVYYDKEEQLKPRFIRKYKPTLERMTYFIEAKSFRNAIVKFFTENEGTGIGGEKMDSRALYIDRDKIILQFPFCPLMNKDMFGVFICGMPHMYGRAGGDIGFCAIENYAPPENCTFVSFKCRFFMEYEKYKKIAKINEKVLGFKIIKSNQVAPAKFPPITFT